MQETKIVYSFELHVFGRRICAFQFVRTTDNVPIGKMLEIIDRVAKKVGVVMEEDVNEG